MCKINKYGNEYKKLDKFRYTIFLSNALKWYIANNLLSNQRVRQRVFWKISKNCKKIFWGKI